MALSDIVQQNLTRQTAAVAQRGFSLPLVLGYHTHFVDRVRSVTSLKELEELGFNADETVHKDVAAIFSQPRPPAVVKIGRREGAVEQIVHVTPTAVDETRYALSIDGREASFTSDDSAAPAEIVAGLVAAVNGLADDDAVVTAHATAITEQTVAGLGLNGAVGHRTMSPSRRLFFTLNNHNDIDGGTAVVTGRDASGNEIEESFTIPNGTGGAAVTVLGTKLFAKVTEVVFPAGSGVAGSWRLGTRAPMTATDGATHVVLTGVAGHVAAVKSTGRGPLALADATAGEGAADDFAACVTEDPAFYGVLLDSNAPAEMLELAAAIEPHANRYALIGVASDAACKDPDSIDDVLYQLKDLARFRTAMIFHPTVGVRAASAWMGNGIAYAPGSISWHLREVRGVESYELTSEERAAIIAKNGNLFETNLGRHTTINGKTSGGEWLDIIHGLDWHFARVGERVFGAMVAQQDSKIPLTDDGIGVVHTELRAQMKAAESGGLFAAGWTTAAPLAASLTATQRRSRALSGMTYRAEPAGAIHAVEINGTVTG